VREVESSARPQQNGWRLHSLNKISVLLLGGLKLVLMSGVFTVFGFHKMDLSLVWWKLVWMADPRPGCAG
jgi:hypothetical protein